MLRDTMLLVVILISVGMHYWLCALVVSRMVAWWVSYYCYCYVQAVTHIDFSISLGPLITILLSLNTCTLSLLNTAVQYASYSTGTDISMRSISLNPCPFCASAGSSGDSCSCQVVTQSIVFVLATLTLVTSCGSLLPRYLCLLDRNILVAAKSGCPCGNLLLFIIALNLEIRVDRRDTLLLCTVATAAAYNVCLLLLKNGM